MAYGLLGACGGVVSVESGSNDGGADAGESVGMVPGGDGEAAPDSGTMGIDARSDDGGGCPHGRVLCNGVCRCLVTLASGGEPAAIAIDDTAVYWTSIGVGSDAGTVMTVPKTGGLAATLASGQSGPQGLAVDRRNVYWTNNGTSVSVMSVPSGGGPSVSLAPPQDNPYGTGITVDALSVYWATSNGTGSSALMKVLLAGGAPTILATVDSPGGVAVDATSVYWTSLHAGGSVMKIPVGGGAPTTLASGPDNYPNAVVVDAANVYWTNSFTGKSVAKVPVAGGAVTVLAAGQANPGGLAVDDTSVYWVNRDDGTVMKVPIAGGAPTALASGQDDPQSIVVDTTSVYWTNPYGDAGAGAVMKLTPK